MSLRVSKIVLFTVMCGLSLAALYVSTLTAERHDALRRVSRYNMTWLASQAGTEFERLEQRIAAAGIPGSKVDADEVQLRLDILANRLNLVDQGDFAEFASRNPDIVDTVAMLSDAIKAVQPLVDHIDQPGNIIKALNILRPLDSRLAEMAAVANRFGGERVAEDQRELLRLHYTFSVMVAGLLLCGFFLVGLLGWHNQLLERARSTLHKLAEDLRLASGELEQAHGELQTVNAELQSRNQILQRRDRELGTQNKRFDAAVNNMSQALCMVDAHQQLVVCNQRFAELFGLDFAPMPGMMFGDLVQLSSSASLRDIHGRQAALMDTGGHTGFIHEFEDGRTLSVSHQPMPDGGWVATYEDITQRRQAEAQITYLAHHDGLTGLVNRRFFNDQIRPALARADRQNRRIAALCLDLDGFKDVNDSLGHTIGDALLREVGVRIKENAREGDIVARLGGDEFAVLQTDVESPEQTASLAERLIERISRPYLIDGCEIAISASIGIATSPLEGRMSDDLIKNADMALHRAKEEGRHTFRFFEADMDAARKGRRAFEADLRKALAQGEFEIFYQPIVDVRKLQVSGFEALIRWNHPVRGRVSPAEFIPVAEEVGLISSIGEWVLHNACARAMTWPGQLTVAINLSPAQFQSSLLDMVKAALASSGLPTARLELEITESVLLRETDATLTILHDLRALGIRIAMDDFGTGYSSLSYLRSFPFDKIKIDQSFVRELSTRPDCIKIVGSIAALASSLGMVTTAEGVETAEQFEQLRRVGCDQVQGYLFDRPAPADQLRFTVRNLKLQPAEAA